MENSWDAKPRIVVLGIGNILLKDEGVGVRVTEELHRTRALPANVQVVDGGTAGLDLLGILEGASHIVVVDCVLAGQEPGTILHAPMDRLRWPAGIPQSLHQVGILEVFGVLEMLGRRPWGILIGVEPAEITLGLELSPVVEAKLPAIVEAVERELEILGAGTLPIPPGSSPGSSPHPAGA